MSKDKDDRVKVIKTKLRKPVVLVGLMGCGKSHAGKLLAQRLDMEFIDSDREIEKMAGCSISEIFARDGEGKFRDSEKMVIAALLDSRVRVVATGGGALMNAQTAALVRSKAVSIWINADINDLVERVGHKGGRPLLAGGDTKKILTDLLKARKPAYEKADIIVNGGDSVAQLADSMVGALHEFLCEDES